MHLLAIVLVLNVGAWFLVYGWWKRLDRVGMGQSSIESATGLSGSGTVRHLEPPHTGSNYLLKEMGYSVARKHASKLRRIALLAGGVAPTLLVACAMIWTVRRSLFPQLCFTCLA